MGVFLLPPKFAAFFFARQRISHPKAEDQESVGLLLEITFNEAIRFAVIVTIRTHPAMGSKRVRIENSESGIDKVPHELRRNRAEDSGDALLVDRVEQLPLIAGDSSFQGGSSLVILPEYGFGRPFV